MPSLAGECSIRDGNYHRGVGWSTVLPRAARRSVQVRWCQRAWELAGLELLWVARRPACGQNCAYMPSHEGDPHH